jgi:hypothetical protein
MGYLGQERIKVTFSEGLELSGDVLVSNLCLSVYSSFNSWFGVGEGFSQDTLWSRHCFPLSVPHVCCDRLCFAVGEIRS